MLTVFVFAYGFVCTLFGIWSGRRMERSGHWKWLQRQRELDGALVSALLRQQERLKRR